MFKSVSRYFIHSSHPELACRTSPYQHCRHRQLLAASLTIEDVLLVHLTHDALIEKELRMKRTIGGPYKRDCRML